MPRIARNVPPNSLVHLISNFAYGEFVMDGPDSRSVYLEQVERALRHTDWLPIAFAFMSSHIHWALIAGLLPPRSFYHPLHTAFALWVKRQRKASGGKRRIGPVFGDRPTLHLVENDLALRLLAYIHNNPVRAGCAADALSSDWTSHPLFLEPALRPTWLDAPLGLKLAGFQDTHDGRTAFHQATLDFQRRGSLWIPDQSELRATWRCVRAELRAPVGLATPHIEASGEACFAPIVPANARCPVDVWQGSVDDFIELAAQEQQLDVRAMCSRSCARKDSQARRVALLAWVHHLGRAQRELAQAFGLSDSAASTLLRRCDHRRLEALVPAERLARAARKQAEKKQKGEPVAGASDGAERLVPLCRLR